MTCKTYIYRLAVHFTDGGEMHAAYHGRDVFEAIAKAKACGNVAYVRVAHGELNGTAKGVT